MPEGDYILRSLSCKVIHFLLPERLLHNLCGRVLDGAIDQNEAMGLSRELRRQGYGFPLRGTSDGFLEAETQDEDEV